MNNKGFAITTILYGTLILFCLLLVSMLGILATYRNNLDKLINASGGARSLVSIDSIYGIRATFTKDSGISSVGLTTINCDVVPCTITLPTINPVNGYVSLGWYENTTYIGQPGEQVTLNDNVTYIAKSMAS